MDCESNKIEKIVKIIPIIQEDFLINISNKGIVNRSKKDLTKIFDNISITINDLDKLQVAWDDINVILEESIQNSKCSCPSMSLCKHVIIALLYIKEFYEQNKDRFINDNKTQKKTTPYEDLENITLDELQSLVGKNQYNTILRSIICKQEAEFNFDDVLSVNIPALGVTVYIPKENSISNMMCSCKEKGMCRHKAYALISYLFQIRKIDLTVDEDIISIEEERDFLENLKSFSAKLLETGLVCISKNELQDIEKLYKVAYSKKFFKLATDLKSLSSQIGLYFDKNVSFSLNHTMHLVCLIYNRADAILCQKNNTDNLFYLIGKKNEDNMLFNQLNFIGLGAFCRLTQRKEMLLSACFYCNELKAMFIMSTLRPFENIQPEFLFRSGLAWSEDVSFELASVSHVVLKDAKITLGKLSSSKSTVCQIKGKTGKKDFEEIAIKNFSVLQNKLKKEAFHYFDFAPESDYLFLLKVEKIKVNPYDKVEQEIIINVYDYQNNKIQLSIKYSILSETAIRFWEFKKDSNVFEYVLAKVWEKGGMLKGTFISGINNEKIYNIYFKEK